MIEYSSVDIKAADSDVNAVDAPMQPTIGRAGDV
jgi:hypothetical protein